MLAISSSQKFKKPLSKDSDFPFFYEDMSKELPVLYDAKKNILNDFLDISAKASSLYSKTHITGSQMKKLLEEWSSNGDFNQIYNDQLAQDFYEQMNNSFSGMVLEEDFRSNLSNAKLEASLESWAESSSAALQSIGNLMEKYSIVLQNSVDSMELATIATAIADKTNSIDTSSIQSGSSFDRNQIKNADESVITYLENLDKIVEELLKINSSGGHLGEGIKIGNKTCRTPLQLIKATKGIFRSLSGEGAHEIVAAAAANKVGIEIDNVDDTVKEIFRSSGGKISMSGTQETEKKNVGNRIVKAKPDFTITASSDNVSFAFHASAKFRSLPYQKKYKGKMINEVISYDVDVGELLSMAVESGMQIFEQGWGVQLFEKNGKKTRRASVGDFSELYTLWEEFNQMSMQLAFIRGFVGNGQIYGESSNKMDWNSIIVIRDKAYSLYDMLKDIGKYSYISSFNPYSSNDGYTNKSYTSIGVLHDDIYTDETGNERIKATKEKIETLYKTKMHISIDLVKLSQMIV